jgi:hypothetical protein
VFRGRRPEVEVGARVAGRRDDGDDLEQRVAGDRLHAPVGTAVETLSARGEKPLVETVVKAWATAS